MTLLCSWCGFLLARCEPVRDVQFSLCVDCEASWLVEEAAKFEGIPEPTPIDPEVARQLVSITRRKEMTH